MKAVTPDVKSIFGEALEIDAGADRAAFLDRACGGDAALRSEVEALLNALTEAADFMKQPAAVESGVVARPELAERPGMTVGAYRLREEIGEGGMGLVFVAEQEAPIRREVALKVIRPGMDTREVISRFEAERQALALMDHPHIAKVLDGGATDSGRPFFVMELVKGMPITKFCDEHTLTPRQRLELCIPVCQAVQHAHQKGIIHRDLTPGNILVTMYDGQPTPKVIDFGIAKAIGPQLTGKIISTRVAQILGTPTYMSPEQAGMGGQDIDTRSDIYSLGVLLYELLTGTTPVDGQRLRNVSYDEIRRIIREEEPPAPSTRISACDTLVTISARRHTEPARLCKLVRGDLDWIVMKCLEKDRTRRYETANELAMDLRRYLADEPVLACPPSAAYRLRKFARRNRSGLAVAGLMLLFLVLVGSVAGWAWRDRAARAAEQSLHLEQAVERAELLQREGKRGEALAAVERAQLLAGETEPAASMAQRMHALRRLLDGEGQDEALVVQLAAIRREEQTAVDFDNNVFHEENAYPRLHAALEQYGIAIGVTPTAAVASRIQERPAAVQTVVVVALNDCLRFVPREESSTRQWLIDVLLQADSDPWRNQVRRAWTEPQTLETLVKDLDVRQQPTGFLVLVVRGLPNNSPSRWKLVRGVQFAYPGDFWANLQLGLDLSGARKHAEAIRYYTAALGQRPDNPGVLFNRGLALQNTAELEAAVGDLQRAVAVAPRYAAAYRALAQALSQQKKLDEAILANQQAVRLQPNNAHHHHALACSLRDKGDFKGAIGHFDTALELDPKHPWARSALAGTLALQGQSLCRNGKLDAAIASFRKACELQPTNATFQCEVANALGLQGKLDEAIAVYQEVLRLQPDNAYPHHAFGCFLRDVKRDYEGAAGHFNKALELDPKNGRIHYDFGHALLRHGKLDEAAAAFRAAISLKTNTAGARDALAWVLNKQAWPLATDPAPARRDPGRAVSLAKEAVELAPQKATYANTLGTALYRTGEWKAAIAALEKSMELSKGGTSADWFLLAMAHWQLGEKATARAWHDRAVQWMDKNPSINLELRRFRAEAAALLGVKVQKDDKPK